MLEMTCEMLGANGSMKARISAKYAPGEPPFLGRVSLDSERSRKRFTERLAELAGEDPAEIEAELLRIAEDQAEQPPVEPAAGKDEPPPLSPQQREQAELFVRSPDVFDQIASDIEALGLQGEKYLGLTIYLVFTSRALKNPLAAVVQGPSGAGKTFAVEIVGGMFPPEALFRATTLSDQAWYYLDDGAVRHKAVILGEREQSNDPSRVDARRAWRELVVSGEASRVVTIIDPQTREPRTVKRTVYGPCAFIETTTSEFIMEEDASRMLSLRPSESQHQTKCVIQRTAMDAAGLSTNDAERQAIVDRHHAVQRLLAEHAGTHVAIPYAPCIHVPTEQIVARRVFPFVLSMVRAVSLIRILQKPGGREAEADLVDYAIAYPLIRPLVARQLHPLTDTDLEALSALADSSETTFTASRAGRVWGVGDRQSRRRLWRLHQSDLLEETERSRDNRREYRLLSRQARPDAHVLTPPEDLAEAWAERQAVMCEHANSVVPGGGELVSDGT